MLKPAKSKRGSKSKRKGRKNTGHPVQLWRKCNDESHTRRNLRGEYVDNKPRTYADGTEQHRGHCKLEQCDCLARADWPDNYSDDYLAVVTTAKAIAKRAKQQERANRTCPAHYTLLPVTGECAECAAAA